MPQGIPVSHCPGSNSHILVMSPEPRVLGDDKTRPIQVLQDVSLNHPPGCHDLVAKQQVHSETPATGWMAPNHI